ncbi:MAG: hypothetical protein KBH07_09830 [Flavobacteriales bacterium]|nr:hypothetical protein [Flavobacteriales bacterium]MBP9080253.1 hypothetical protein [Flavobacteriales bacterium]
MLQRSTYRQADRLLSKDLVRLVHAVQERWGAARLAVLHKGEARRAELRHGQTAPLNGTVAIRQENWHVDPVPAQLLERRVELIGGCSRKELIDGMNSGAKGYVADLWNMTHNEPDALLRAHKNIERAADLRLAYVDTDGGRIRINPQSTTRLMCAPRPLHVLSHVGLGFEQPVAAAFLDLALLATYSGEKLRQRQGGIHLYLHGVRGHEEAGLWKDLFMYLEAHFGMPRGTFRATVKLDNLAVVLEADEVLYELRHHAAGLALAPQGYAADHVALFSTPERPALPDRGHIGFNAAFLRSVSLRAISICHRRGVHAMGASAYVLPPETRDLIKPDYLEMIADKEREALDGHDGTLVAHPGLVNAAMAEFNKSMPRAHQMDYQPEDHTTLEDLTRPPTGELTTEGIQCAIRVVIKALTTYHEHQGLVEHGGRLHDRSSVYLSMLLLWHWTQSKACFITSTGLEVHNDVMKFLIRKEGEKLFATHDAAHRERAKLAAQRLTALVLSPDTPPEFMELVQEMNALQ